VERKEWPKGHGDYFVRKRSLSRQRVAARYRPENITTTTVENKSSTAERFWRPRRWLPWSHTPEGGRL
jgi:hypothetical protein